MTLNQMKSHFFNERTELGMASVYDILRLCDWLESWGGDADLAYSMWRSAKQELDYAMQELLAEFG